MFSSLLSRDDQRRQWSKRFFLKVIPAILLVHTLYSISTTKTINNELSHSQNRILTQSSPSQKDTTSNNNDNKGRQLNEVVVPNEASYIQMCRYVLKPHDTSVFVREHPSVCLDHKSPHRALLQIYASSLLNEISRRHNLGVTYSHKCDNARADFTKKDPTTTDKNKDKNDKDKKDALLHKTIQEMLPTPYALKNIDGNNWSNEISLDATRSLCRHCLLEGERQGHDASPDCILFSDSSGRPPRRDATIPATSEQRRRSLQQQQPPTVPHPVVSTILPHIKRSIRTATSRWNPSHDLQNPILRESYAVAYLSCIDESTCDESRDSLADFRHIFAEEIPSHVGRIDIVSSVPFAEMFDEGVQELRRWAVGYYTRAEEVRYVVETSTFVAFSRLMRAKYVVCNGGRSCVFPALSSVNVASVVEGEVWKEWMEDDENEVNLITPGFKLSQCRFLRGRYGRWEKDLELAPKMQYERHPELDPRDWLMHPSTTYRWEETNFRMCQLSLMTKDKLCNVLYKLKVDRLFFFGDSLTRQMTESIWKIINHTNEPIPLTQPEKDDTEYPYWNRIRLNDYSHTITCPNIKLEDNNSHYQFEFMYLRNDYITEVNIGLAGDNVALPWIDRYTNYTGKTVMVVNTGPHVHDFGTFQRVFDGFVRAVDRFAKKDDIIIYRPTVPGHKECHLLHEPFTGYPQFLENLEMQHERYTGFHWEKFVEYNDYAARSILRRNRITRLKERGKGRTKPLHKTIEILDVYLMGVLRPDGHLKPGTANHIFRDCLHSRLPGPLDWWNHLLYSNLASMAMELDEGE